ncbi:MAG: fused response regulator/phosphatase, partial [Pseudomonadales bacterium]|nr:fused response regulator/phosphatase [Pseudomonadales bacterium]
MDSLRVLIADDNPIDRMVLSKIVKKSGHEVIMAVDGIDAIEKYHGTEPDLILLDALMPGKDGFEVAEYIKKEDGEGFTPIIFLTSLSETEDLARCLDAGGDDFISKPYSKVVVRAKIDALSRVRKLYSTMQDNRNIIEHNHLYMLKEQKAAKDIFDNITHTGCLDAPNIEYLLSPVAVFNGDVLLAAQNPAGGMNILLGDFTGHGLTAAIGAMPLAEIFYSMSKKGFSIGQIIGEVNTKLHNILPVGYFCCATILSLDFDKHCVEIWSGGLPPGYIVKAKKGEMIKLGSANLALGIVNAGNFDDSTKTYELEVGDSVVLTSDGILEARNSEDEMFESERYEASLQNSTQGSSAFENILADVTAFMGDAEADDDLTLLECFMVDKFEVSKDYTVYSSGTSQGPPEWKMSFELGATALKVYNPLPLLQHILMEVPALRENGAPLYSILSELFSNALDHGVLGLDSAIKQKPDGFTEYYSMRSERLKMLESGYVRFDIVCTPVSYTHLTLPTNS